MPLEFELTDNSKDVLNTLEEKINTALELCGLVAEGYAARLCPVDTGRLRNSITHVTNKNSGMAKSFTYDVDAGKGKTISVTDTTILVAEENQVTIGTNVEYAPYVEMGTVKTKAQPFLGPSITNHISQYEQIVEQTLKN